MIAGLVFGSIAMTLIMVPMNYIFTVNFFGVPFDAVNDMMLPVIVPFNLIKALANSAIAFAVFKTVGKYLVRLSELGRES